MLVVINWLINAAVSTGPIVGLASPLNSAALCHLGKSPNLLVGLFSSVGKWNSFYLPKCYFAI